MCCASVLAQAAITITPANDIYVGGTAYSGYGIYGAKEGELAQLLNGTYTGTVQWNGATLDQLKSAVLIKVGSSSSPNVLGNADLAALDKLTGARFLDIDGSQLAAGANISSIKAGPNIEAVTLPNQLTKEQVNAAGAVLKTCNANFGSCMSLDAEMEEKEIYVYTDPCTSAEVEYTGTVSGSTGHLSSITRPLTEAGSTFAYTNTKFRNELSYCDASEVSDGKCVPNPLKVELTVKYLYSYNGTTYNPANEWWLNDDGTVNSPHGGPGLPEGTQLEPIRTYTYKWRDNYQDEGTYTYNGVPQGNETDGFYAMIENTYTAQAGYQFDVTSTYNYTYTDPTDTENPCSVKPASYTDGPHTTIDIPCNLDVALTAKTVNVPVPGKNVAVAYVNTPGSLYQAVSLDVNDASTVEGLIISGNINNADISVHANATDPNASQKDADAFTSTGATPAFYVNHSQAPIKSVDMSDAVIADYKHLRVLNAYGLNLESVVFPKTVTRIPNYCCYANGNSGNHNLANIVFPTEATTLQIGDYAFCDIAISDLVLPSSITSVGNYAFYTCKKLENIEMEPLKSSCTFGEFVFASTTVKHVTLSEGVDGISAHMFDACGSLESIRIPTTAKKIKTAAFNACVSLHKLVIPEGVEEFEKNVFNLAGLTDIYVMATSADKVPKIYDVGNSGDTEGTFTKRNILGNNTAPNKIYRTDYDETTSEETALSWYQEEFSDMNFGIGGNNCMIQLHYPENMKSFYNGVENIPANWSDNLISYADKNLAEWQVSHAQEWISEIYALGSEEYYGAGHNSARKLGPTEGNLYWPKAQDYYIRLAIGYTPGDEPTAAAWRQIPLQGITSADEFIYTKKYDDTWYTMCFPWDMDDNTLFSTFNQKCEIVEFKGAEVFKESDTEYNLIFHFDDVAKTYYMPEDHSAKYERIESEHTRSVEYEVSGSKFTRNYYTYQNVEDANDLVYWPYDLSTAEGKAMQKKYNEILHMMVFAGHPYMIHPSIGAKAGQPKDCTIAGVKKFAVGDKYEGVTYNTLADLAEAQKQTRTVTSNERGGTSTEAWKNPKTGAGGKYTFIGNINDDVDGDKGVQDMPTENGPVYFLGVESGSYYPKYYKKPQGKGQGKWSQYSAIIVPDADAITNVEGLDGMVAGSTSNAKQNVVFGDWEILDEDQMTTVIDNAVAEGKDKNEPAKIQHVNVVYNIKGQIIRSNSTSVEGLPKGLYIVNGKKYMVK